MNERRTLLLLILVFAGLLFFEKHGSWLFEPDEARYAEIPREMLATSDFLTPRLNGSMYFEKPPLLYWLNAASMKALGQTPYAARLPTRLAALVTALMLLACLEGNAGPWAALVFLSAPLSFTLGRVNLTDGILSATLTAALFCLRAFFKARNENRSGALASIGLGASTALAVLSKGLVGIVFPVGIALVWVALVNRWRLIRDVLFSWALPVFLILAVPWFVLVERANPGFAYFFFIHEHFLRYATSVHHRNEPVYFFVGVFLGGFFPWLLPIIRSTRSFFKVRISEWKERPDELFFLLWFGSVVGFFSLSHSKLVPYILPAFPAAAALVGKWIASEIDSPKLGWRIYAYSCSILLVGGCLAAQHFLGMYHLLFPLLATTVLISLCAWFSYKKATTLRARAYIGLGAPWAVLYFLLIYMLPNLAQDYSAHSVMQTVSQTSVSRVVCYKTYVQGAPFELGRPVTVADFQGELVSIGPLNPDLFWKKDAFWTEWEKGTPMVALIQQDEAHELDNESRRPFVWIARNHRIKAAANYIPGK
jgi:4-amino-4-deoxy-L-arabinose transferase-like glycosyltransferase